MNVIMVPRWRGAALVTTLVLALSACGGDDGSSSREAGDKPAVAASNTPAAPVASGSGVEVVAQDIAFAPTELTVGAAPTKITLRNEGAIPHTFVIEGAPNFEGLKVDANGESDSAILDIAPGTYTASVVISNSKGTSQTATETITVVTPPSGN